jgi:integrase
MKPTGKHPHKRLTAQQVNNAGPGRHGDGNGLYLVVDESLARRWVLRAMVSGKRKDIGLGGTQIVSLAQARTKALELHADIRNGKDPVAERRARLRTIPTFGEAAKIVHQQLLPTWKNAKHGDQWINTINTYAIPRLGAMKLDSIGTPDILATLLPIWLEKAETASRVKQRIHAIFDWAKTMGYRTGENPVDGVKRGLPKQSDKEEHHKALPYDQVPSFIRALRCGPSGMNARLGFEFLILTATRTSEVLNAKWQEVDFANRCWTIPASRMKAGKEHRVPLSPRCIEILTEAKRIKREDDLLFPGEKANKPLSNMTFTQILRRAEVDAVAHGFRSSFRDWAAEQTNFPNEVGEHALAHTVKNKVEAAYKRTDLYNKRIELMNAWASYATAGTIATLGKVAASPAIALSNAKPLPEPLSYPLPPPLP